jgi:uncharacterized DUF497 family protein
MAVVTIDGVVFEWDDPKADLNLAKHGVTFAEAATVFRDGLGRFRRDARGYDGEERFILIGLSAGRRILTVVYVEREERIRVISARAAKPRERRDRERRNEKSGMGRRI